MTVLFTQDGVYATPDTVDRGALTMIYIEDLQAAGGRLFADGLALSQRDIDPESIADGIEVLSQKTVTRNLREADHTLDF